MLGDFLMKKSLIILPIAVLALSACLPAKGGKTSSSKTSGSGGPTVDDTTVDLGPEEYQGYKRLMAAPENGKTYILGMYQANLSKNLFYNGGPHSDANGEYPFYLSCTEDTTKATKVKVEYTDTEHFTIKDIGGGEKTRYTNQYLRVYESLKGSDSKITSLSFYDGSPDGAKVDPGNPDHEVEYSNDQFYFLKSYNYGGEVISINTIAADLASQGYAAQPIILGTYDEYISIGAVTPNHFGTNYMTFLWEAK